MLEFRSKRYQGQQGTICYVIIRLVHVATVIVESGCGLATASKIVKKTSRKRHNDTILPTNGAKNNRRCKLTHSCAYMISFLSVCIFRSLQVGSALGTYE